MDAPAAGADEEALRAGSENGPRSKLALVVEHADPPIVEIAPASA